MILLHDFWAWKQKKAFIFSFFSYFMKKKKAISLADII